MPTIRRLAESFARQQKAERKSPHTINTYHACIEQLARHIETTEGSDDIAACTRRSLNDFFAVRSDSVKATTASIEFRALRVFFKWCVEENELETSPMLKLHQPRIPLKPPPIFSTEELVALRKACEGHSFLDRRDMAILMLLIDTGMRRGELCGLTIADIDLRTATTRVTGKGKTRIVPLGNQSSLAIDRYLRVRARHSHQDRPELWLGLAGPMTPNGLYQAIRERGKAAGVENVFLHRFRHTFAHRWMAGNEHRQGSETDLMTIAGWSSRTLLDRCARQFNPARPGGTTPDPCHQAQSRREHGCLPAQPPSMVESNHRPPPQPASEVAHQPCWTST